MSQRRSSRLLCLTVLCLAAACLCGCGKPPVTPSPHVEKTHISRFSRFSRFPNFPGVTHTPQPSRITASLAVARARKALASPAWQVAFLSNTGVTQQVLSQAPDSGLMHPDGTADQWVVEAFKNSPKPYRENGQTKTNYPFQVVAVSAGEAELLPASDDGIVVPKVLPPLKQQYLDGLDGARKLAVRQVRTKFDVLSASSEVRADGSCKWRFRFYDLKQQTMVGKVCVSGDGTRILAW